MMTEMKRLDAANIEPNAFHGRDVFSRDTSNRLHVLQDSHFGDVLQRFDGVKGKGNQLVALCPAHDDRTPSLSIKVERDRLLLNCFSGCTVEAIVQSVGLTFSDLFRDGGSSAPTVSRYPAPILSPTRLKPKKIGERNRRVTGEWEYHDKAGQVIAVKRRYDFTALYDDGSEQERKEFRQNPRGQLPLYRLPHVLSAIRQGWPVFLTEGEAKADRVNDWWEHEYAVDAVATTYGGHWQERHAETLVGCSRVILVPDRDEPGQKKARSVSNDLLHVGLTVATVDLSPLFGDEAGRIAA